MNAVTCPSALSLNHGNLALQMQLVFSSFHLDYAAFFVGQLMVEEAATHRSVLVFKLSQALRKVSVLLR